MILVTQLRAEKVIEMNKESIRKYYSEIDDSKLLYILNNEYSELEFHAKEIITEEAKKRNLLNSDNVFSINAQEDSYTFDDIKRVAISLQSCTCPICNKNTGLNGFKSQRYFVIIYRPVRSNIFRIACKNCHLKQARIDILLTVLGSMLTPLFFISIPAMLLWTLWGYFELKKQSFDIPSKELLGHVSSNIKYYASLISNRNQRI